MALIKCPECGGDVSSLAAACPHCGLPIAKVMAQSDAGSAAALPPPPECIQNDTQAGQSPDEGRTLLTGLSVIAIILFVIGCLSDSAVIGWLSNLGLERQAQNEMGRIEQQVAEDAVKQYDIAKRSGSAIDAYLHAGLVSAAYLQAKDESNYQKWKKIEAEEARHAGVPTL
jgi:hypothetical protein